MGERGHFVVFEGIDGSGKSTQVGRLKSRINAQGGRAYTTAEPTLSPIGMLIRNAFSGRLSMDDRTIAALFAADRIDHLTNESNGILKLLQDGVTVICDRYHLSSHAYHAADVGHRWVEEANSLSTDLLKPALTVFLDIEPTDALHRLESERMFLDRFERRSRLDTARRGYLAAIERFRASDNVVVVSGLDPVQEIADAVWQCYTQLPPAV